MPLHDILPLLGRMTQEARSSPERKLQSPSGSESALVIRESAGTAPLLYKCVGAAHQYKETGERAWQVLQKVSWLGGWR